MAQLSVPLDHWLLISIALAVAGCAGRAASDTSPSPICAVGDTALVREVLYFGRNRPGGIAVSGEEWNAFLHQVLTPRFPAGLTVVSGTGQWQGKTGVVEQERSEMVIIFHSGDQTAHQSVREVVTEYKRRFQQEAVLRERMPTCARFE